MTRVRQIAEGCSLAAMSHSWQRREEKRKQQERDVEWTQLLDRSSREILMRFCQLISLFVFKYKKKNTYFTKIFTMAPTLVDYGLVATL